LEPGVLAISKGIKGDGIMIVETCRSCKQIMDFLSIGEAGVCLECWDEYGEDDEE
jgi:hypothetical protein